MSWNLSKLNSRCKLCSFASVLAWFSFMRSYKPLASSLSSSSLIWLSSVWICAFLFSFWLSSVWRSFKSRLFCAVISSLRLISLPIFFCLAYVVSRSCLALCRFLLSVTAWSSTYPPLSRMRIFYSTVRSSSFFFSRSLSLVSTSSLLFSILRENSPIYSPAFRSFTYESFSRWLKSSICFLLPHN